MFARLENIQKGKRQTRLYLRRFAVCNGRIAESHATSRRILLFWRSSWH